MTRKQIKVVKVTGYKVALAQINPTTGDLEGNLEKIIKAIRDAKKKGADIIVLPEMCITGYCIADLVESKRFIQKNKQLLEKVIAKEAKDIVVITGFVDYDENKKFNDGRMVKYNAAAVMQNQKVLGIVHKQLLPTHTNLLEHSSNDFP